MGILARKFQDASREGDGERTIRCWRFLLLHSKEAGHSKYDLEAFNLLAEVDTILTAREAYELKWNRSCSLRGSPGKNITLDLHMEHLNRSFKEKISQFSSHISENNIKRVSKVTKEVDVMARTLDAALGLKPQSSVTASQAPNKTFGGLWQSWKTSKHSLCNCCDCIQHFVTCHHILLHLLRLTSTDSMNGLAQSARN